MRLLAAIVGVALATCPVRADDPKPKPRDAVVPEVFIPVDPYEHERLHYFGRPDRHVVPGVVTIDRTPYHCDLDRRSFDNREDFVAHLQAAHKMPLDKIPDRIVVRDGLVHFIAR